MALNDVYQVTVVHVLNGRETSNLFYYKETKVSVDTPDTIANLLANEFYDIVYVPWWKPIVTARGRLTAIWSMRIWPIVDGPSAQPFTGDEGAIGGDSCPNNAAALLSFGSVIRSRNYQRRSYISGIPESRQIGAELNVTGLFTMRELGDAIVDAVIVGPGLPEPEWSPCAFSKKLAAAADPDPSSLLTFVRITTAIRSMRGRNLFTWQKL